MPDWVEQGLEFIGLLALMLALGAGITGAIVWIAMRGERRSPS